MVARTLPEKVPQKLSRAKPMSQNRNEQSAKHQDTGPFFFSPSNQKVSIRLAGKGGNAPLLQAGNERWIDQACEKEENMTYDHKKKQSIATDLEVTDIKELSDKDMLHICRKVEGI